MAKDHGLPKITRIAYPFRYDHTMYVYLSDGGVIHCDLGDLIYSRSEYDCIRGLTDFQNGVISNDGNSVTWCDGACSMGLLQMYRYI